MKNMGSEIHFNPIVKKGIIVLLIALLLPIIGLSQRPDGNLHIFFLDVGQGDSMLIITPDGKQAIIDGGPDDSALTELNKYLPMLDKKIEMVTLSHPHADHLTGLLSILKRYDTPTIFSNCISYHTIEYQQWEELTKQADKNLECLSQNQSIQLAKGISLYVLWPPKNLDKYPQIDWENINNTSIVLLLKYKNFNALFTGDAEKEVLENLNNIGLVDILKAPHQGSKDALSSEFMNQIKPELTVISVGKDNTYGHPSSEFTNALNDMQLSFLQTDQSGSIHIVTNGETWWQK